MCTLEKRGSLFILTLIGDDHEHRLNPYLIDSLLSALSQVNSQSINGGSALITVAHGKFFCNGFDFPWAQSAGTSATRLKRLLQMAQSFRSVIAALISLPIPTVTAVSGHPAGLILALGHDYVLMRRDRGFLYKSEVDLAIMLPDYFSALVRSKIGCWDIMVDAQCGEVLYIPNVMTPTEVYPVSAPGGSWYISALKRPLYHISMVASQGITIGC